MPEGETRTSVPFVLPALKILFVWSTTLSNTWEKTDFQSEEEDYGSVVGNPKQNPWTRGTIYRGTDWHWLRSVLAFTADISAKHMQVDLTALELSCKRIFPFSFIPLQCPGALGRNQELSVLAAIEMQIKREHLWLKQLRGSSSRCVQIKHKETIKSKWHTDTNMCQWTNKWFDFILWILAGIKEKKIKKQRNTFLSIDPTHNITYCSKNHLQNIYMTCAFITPVFICCIEG